MLIGGKNAAHIASRSGNLSGKADHLQVGNIDFCTLGPMLTGGMQQMVREEVRE